MVAHAARNDRAYANLFEFGIPIWQAGSGTPTYQVSCSYSPEWGPCPFQGHDVPIPDQARPHTGSDGAMVVVDEARGLVYEFWQATKTNGRWTASWGAVNRLDGSGWGGASTGAGASRLAGVVRAQEVADGVIPHALVVQTDNICARSYRAPALKTDGASTRADCIPEGARLQLDPSIDVAAIPGITRAEKAVAVALQTYGAFVIDRGGASMSISFELTSDATAGSPGRAYTAAGLSRDYDGMDRIPWKALRVLD